MSVLFRIPERLFQESMGDLRRPHPFAAERVGFWVCRPATLPDNGLLLLAQEFHRIADEDYVNDQRAGATMGASAIRKALQFAYTTRASMFHVHIHEHRGKPGFSGTDKRETARFVPDFWHVQPELPHGAIVLSQDSACGRCWIPGRDHPADILQFTLVGVPIRRL